MGLRGGGKDLIWGEGRCGERRCGKRRCGEREQAGKMVEDGVMKHIFSRTNIFLTK